MACWTEFYLFTIHVAGICKNNLPFDLKILHNSAQIIRTFIEDYHEKLEQDYLFQCFEQANQFVDLIKVLRAQHQAGRVLTDRILYQANMKPTSNTEDNQKLSKLLNDFSGMYRPHEAREDTVLFPTILRLFERRVLRLRRRFRTPRTWTFWWRWFWQHGRKSCRSWKTAGNLRVIAIYTDYSLIEIVAGLSYSIDGHF